MCTFLWATDRPVLRLGEDLREQALHGGVASLQTYSDLAVLNLERAQLNYKLRPKWHAYAHMIFDLQFSDENCRVHKTLSEETMLGKITKLAAQCPGSNVLERFFQRFCLFLAFHWEYIRANEVPQVD
ncbi:unnamed protein product [Cladocopium goreaui]|uniref:Uncharacterized protein n=1 Tax=Cladocopium goreaui TaxID=2562237 RepID=A0A9P1CHF2_9DINO|nr:unnamed protein product [Cladocopium goreaui]